MARRNEKTKIGDNTYSVTQMDAVKALKVQLYLSKLLAPMITKGGFNNLDISLPTILEKLDDDKFVEFFIEICEQANVKKSGSTNFENVNYNMHFEGGDKLKEAYEVFLFVLKVNFADFIKDVFGVEVDKMLAKAS